MRLHAQREAYMKILLSALLALGTFAVPMHATINVAKPTNGAQFTSPFQIAASSSTCGGVATASMGYSLDNGSAVIEPTSFSASITAAAGAHVLHVKCWGKQTNEQVLLNITVVGTSSSTAPGIVISSPANGAKVTSPFTLSASAQSCNSVPATSLSYSVDGAAAVTEPLSFSASLSKNLGNHTVKVTCKGLNTSTSQSISIDVVTPPTAATPQFSVPAGRHLGPLTVSLADSTASAAIYYTLDGSAPSTSSLKYTGPLTLQASSNPIVIEALAVASGYTNSGLARTSYTVVAPSSPSIPSNAIASTGTQLLSGWRIKHDPATSGGATGAMQVVADPSLSGQAQEFDTTYTNSGGLLYSLTWGNDSSVHNFVYDGYVYIASGSQLINLEMDNNQVMANGDTVIYAFQCSGYSGVWEYTSNDGTPSSPIVKWNKSTASCDPRTWTQDAWHHVQIQYSRDDSGNVTYQSVWLDGLQWPLNYTVNSAFSLGWAKGTLVTNFQVDGQGTSGSSTLYLDNLTMYRW